MDRIDRNHQRSEESVIKENLFKGSGFRRYRQQQENLIQIQGRQAGDDNVHQDKHFYRSRDPTVDDDEVDEYEEDESREPIVYQNSRIGACSICHAIVGEHLPGFDQTLVCSHGHVVCNCCVQHFAIQSDMSCVLCMNDAESEQSNLNSRESNCSLNNSYDQVTNTKFQDRQPLQKTDRGNREPLLAQFEGLNYPAEFCSDVDEEHYELQGNEIDFGQRNSYCNIVRRDELNISHSEMHMNKQLTDCSRRPIRCPRLDCAVNVAFSALTHHFLFDHPEVPILSVEPGAKSTLIVSFAGLVSDSSRCLALLLVSGKLTGSAAKLFNGNNIHPKYKNRLPLPVLAARLPCINRYTVQEEVYGGGEGNGDGDGDGDVIIVWVAGLENGCTNATSLQCSVQAIDSVDSESCRSLTYTGPINSLRTAQKPREVFLGGDCVILHEGLVNNITADCSNLNVNVVIH